MILVRCYTIHDDHNLLLLVVLVEQPILLRQLLIDLTCVQLLHLHVALHLRDLRLRFIQLIIDALDLLLQLL